MPKPLHVPDHLVIMCDRGRRKLVSASFRALQEPHEMSDPITIGIDEVGVGSVYGPLVVVGCCNLTGWSLPAIRDSKTIRKEATRQALAAEIRHNLVWTAAEMSAATVDRFDTETLKVRASEKVARDMIKSLAFSHPGRPIRVVMDGAGKCWTEGHVVFESIPKADALVFEVSAASILAKVICDDWITEQVTQDPVLARYGLEKNKGYGTEAHYKALLQYGATPHHRRTFYGGRLIRDAHDRPTPAQQR